MEFLTMINRNIKYIVSGFIFFSFASLYADDTGRQIMEKNNALKKPHTVRNSSVMLIVKGTSKEIKEFSVLNKTDDRESRWRFTFTKPVKMEIISWSAPGKITRQWVNLTGGFQGIAASDMRTSFMGSHFYYEDLADHYVSDYDYKYIGEESVNNMDCFKIEARKKSGLKVYEKRVVYVRKSDYFIVKVEFFEKKGKTKELTMDQIEVIDGIIAARKVTMAKTGNPAENSDKTIIYLKEIEYNKPVNNNQLTP